MSWDDLEPGQDDLVKEGRRNARGIRKFPEPEYLDRSNRQSGGPVRFTIADRVRTIWWSIHDARMEISRALRRSGSQKPDNPPTR